ncbi:MAG: chemotaxis protein CheW [Planctomycetes bacterium]|nr:chemotaxis protein CheW [Planctomycetota bacterium]
MDIANEERTLEGDDSMKNKFLAFRVGDEDYGIEIRHVMEIIVVQKITEIPDLKEFVRGVINLRGKVIPVIDIRIRFQLKPREYDDRTCIIVVNVRGNIVGMIVDSVTEVVDIPEEMISPPPKVSRTPASRFVMGIGHLGDEVKILLDAGKVIKDKSKDTSSSIIEAEVSAY